MSLKNRIGVQLVSVNPTTDEYIYEELILPATRMEIEDAMQRARITENYNNYFDIDILTCPCLPKLTDTKIDGINIKELNHFAKMLSVLSEDELIVLNGVFWYRSENGAYKDGVPMEELINLTYGLDNTMVIQGISTCTELGEFVIDSLEQFENGLEFQTLSS